MLPAQWRVLYTLQRQFLLSFGFWRVLIVGPGYTAIIIFFFLMEILSNQLILHFQLFQIIVMFLQVLECEKNQMLVQTAW